MKAARHQIVRRRENSEERIKDGNRFRCVSVILESVLTQHKVMKSNKIPESADIKLNVKDLKDSYHVRLSDHMQSSG